MDSDDVDVDGGQHLTQLHHHHWNGLLPYPSSDGTALLDEIFAQLKTGLAALDFLELSCVSTKIGHLLNLKLHLTKEEWERLIKVSYQLVIETPCAHAPTMQSFALILLRIFKLPIVKHLTIELEWRPLYDLAMEYLYQPARQARLYSDENCLKAVLKLAERSRKYFSPTAGQELLLEVEQYLNPTQARYISQYVSMVVTFCPNQAIPLLAEKLNPAEGILWSTSSRRLESLNMLLISRLAKVGSFQLQWTPFLSNTLRRHLKLPGGESGPKSISKWNPEEKPGNRMVRSLHGEFPRYFAKWLVRSITDTNGILGELEIWIQSLDSFCHPSNGGSWTNELVSLLCCLVDSLNKRLFRKGLSYELPALKYETVDRFSAIIWPAVNKLIFTKNFYGSLGVQDLIKGLSNISPKLVLMEIINIAEPSLVSLTEPHRTNASIGVLGSVARKMLNQEAFPAGITTMINFLHAILPGIDSNDPMKTNNTLVFISSALIVMPLCDISGSFVTRDDCIENANAEATANLESFVLLFLEQCFHYISNMTNPTEGNEANGSVLMINTLDMFFMQMSPQLRSLALEKVVAYVTDESHIHGAKVLGYLVGLATLLSAERGRVLDMVLDEIEKQLERGAGGEENQTDESCARLICFLNILQRMLQACTESRFDRVMSLLTLGSTCKQKTVATLLAKSFKVLVKGLSGLYPADYKSYQSDVPTLEDFGRLYRLDEVKVNWRQPNVEDIALSIRLCGVFMGVVDGVQFMRTRLLMLRSLLKAILALRSNVKLSPNGTETDRLTEIEHLFSEAVKRIIAWNTDLPTVETKAILIDTIRVALTYRGISRESYSQRFRMLGYLKSVLTYYRRDPLRPRLWYVKRAHLQHLCRLEQMSYTGVRETPQMAELMGILFAYSMDHFPELHTLAQGELGSAVFMSPELSRRLVGDWADRLSSPVIDEDVLKALLSVREGALTSAIASDWSLLGTFLAWLIPLNDRAGIERIPKIYDLITSAFIDSARSFTAPPSRYNGPSTLETILGVHVDAASFNAKREESRKRIVQFLVENYKKMTWRAKIMITTYLLIILNNQDPITDDLLALFVQGCASDVYDVRFSSLQAAKLALHGWNLQNTEKASVSLVGPEELEAVLRISEIEETDDPSKLEFRVETCRLVQSLTDIVGPAAMLDVVKRCILADGERAWPAGKQRATAEWIGGLLKSLHYTQDGAAMSKLIMEVSPLIKLAWSKCGVDSARHWFASLFFACRTRPAAHIQPLYQFLTAELTRAAQNPAVSSTELVILVLSMQAIMKGVGRGIDEKALVPVIMENLFTSQYLVVRRESAHLLREVVRCAEVDLTPLLVGPFSTETVKSLIEFTHSALPDPTLTGLWPALPSLLPLFLRSHHSDEIELQLATKLVCRRAAWIDACPSANQASALMGAVAGIAQDRALVGQVRRLAVEVMGSVYGRNHALFDATMGEEYLEALLGLLDDEALEVREGTASILTALLHTRPALASRLATQTLPRLRSLLPTLKSPTGLLPRHSTTLLASSLILSTPYQMPSWAPSLLFALTKFLPDRAPVAGTIRKTFSEFKRTHMDSWAVERVAFSEEELDAISELLVSPSYYA